MLLSALLCAASGVRLYVTLDNPMENPQYARNFAHPPPPGILGNITRFATYRGFQINSTGYIINYESDFQLYFDQFHLGDVIWPEYHFLLAPNLGEVLEAVYARNLLVTDIWDYVPGMHACILITPCLQYYS